MAGSQLARLQNQIIVFFTITLKKELNPNTQSGKLRIILIIILCMGLTSMVFNGDASSNGMSQGYNSFEDDSSGLQLFDDEGGDDDDGEDNGDGGSGGGDDEEEDEGDEDGGGSGSGDSDDGEDDEEDNDDGGSNENVEETQKTLLKEQTAMLKNFFSEYHTPEDLDSHFSDLASTYSHLGPFFKTEVIGNSVEGRKINSYSVGYGKQGKNVLVVGAEHSAEWSAAMAVAYFVTRMVMLFSIKQEVTDVLENVRFIVVPVANPDGLAYTFGKSHDARYWQKNRGSKHHKKGVDLYADWDSFSQPETQAIRQLASHHKGKLHGFVSVHCCGGAVLVPSKMSCGSSNSKKEQHSVAQNIAKEMSKPVKGRTEYPYGSKVVKTDKSVKASAVEWVNREHGVTLSFTFESRPASTSKKSKSHKLDKKALLVSPTDAVETGRDVAFGLLELGRYISSDYTPETTDCGGGGAAVSSHDDDGEEDDVVESNSGNGDDDEDSGSYNNEDNDEDSNSGSNDEDDGGDELGGDEDEETGDNDFDGDNDEIGGDEDEDTGDNDSAGDEDVEDNDGNDFEADEDDGDQGNDDVEEVSEQENEIVEEETAGLRGSKRVQGVDFTKQFVKAVGVHTPLLGTADLPPEDGSGPYSLYFAYNVDMYYALLVNAGIDSVKKVVNAHLNGFALDYTYFSKKTWKSGVVDIVRHHGRSVVGVIYRIKKDEIDILDTHNLVHGGNMERIKVTVEDKSGNRYKCFTYRNKVKVAGFDIDNKYKRFHPSRQYRNCLIRGAKLQHLPTEYIENRLHSIGPKLVDKKGSKLYRNERIGTLCDVNR